MHNDVSRPFKRSEDRGGPVNSADIGLKQVPVLLHDLRKMAEFCVAQLVVTAGTMPLCLFFVVTPPLHKLLDALRDALIPPVGAKLIDYFVNVVNVAAIWVNTLSLKAPSERVFILCLTSFWVSVSAFRFTRKRSAYASRIA